ncbi:hypothetical protein ACFW2I_40440 [Streptomyces nigra]|uniref:hypothetical protein n=1 Tax=Streptomyces nigra TaxID=1827580 RepID=UPI00368BB1EE
MPPGYGPGAGEREEEQQRAPDRALLRVSACSAQGVRTITLTSELGDSATATRQLTLDPDDNKAYRVEAADRARRRFGQDAVLPATLASFGDRR